MSNWKYKKPHRIERAEWHGYQAASSGKPFLTTYRVPEYAKAWKRGYQRYMDELDRERYLSDRRAYHLSQQYGYYLGPIKFEAPNCPRIFYK